MKHWGPALLLALASLMPGVSSAREPALPCRSETATMLEEDANGDGQVTLLEARAAALALFEHFDRDGDGAVERAEADASAPTWRERRREVRFAALDRNRDGGVSPEEITLSPRRFARADRDRDGRLSRREVWAAFERGRARGDTAALRAMFWRRDLNRDGHVTRAEALAAADRRFMRRDRDRNGVIESGRERTARR
ncbi:MAG TPA: hypothetical protein VMG12_02565 [Polyangiaceae bacterium]|nr:hypothetical protein [Polyangiaceae bacterium]